MHPLFSIRVPKVTNAYCRILPTSMWLGYSNQRGAKLIRALYTASQTWKRVWDLPPLLGAYETPVILNHPPAKLAKVPGVEPGLSVLETDVLP